VCADLIHEEGAVGRHFEQAGFVLVRSREAAPQVAEQLRFEERVLQPRAVDGDDRCGGAPAPVMDQPADDFLSDARFTRDQNLRVAPCGVVDAFNERSHPVSSADQTNV
jgi:hypothetical protein